MRNPHTHRGAWLALSAAAVLAGTGCSSTAPTAPAASAAPGTLAAGQAKPPTATPSLCADGTIAATFSNGASVCGSQAPVTPAGASAVTVNTYLGIQYATAERFQAPVLSPPKGTGVVQTQPGAYCPQANTNTFHPQDENCLYLNVFTPQSAIGAAKQLPVLFFIHGGAFVEGSGYIPNPQGNLYDGSYLAATGNMVVVTINYRLGALGFLAIDNRTENPSIGGPLTGNFGILDQQAALTWVQQYIGAFGGDPTRVTVAGESAGAMSTGLHLFAAPVSKNLFKAAIMESNPVGSVYRTPEKAQVMGARFRDHLCKIVKNCGTLLNPNPVLMSASKEQIVAAQGQVFIPRAVKGSARNEKQMDLQKASAAPLVGLLSEAAPQVRDGLPWSPTLDGTVITGQPLAGYAANMPAKPFVFGINRDEGAVFADMAATALEARLKPIVINGMINDIVLPWVFGKGAGAIKNYTVQGTTPYKAPAASSPGYMSATAVTLSNIINDFAFRCGNLAMAGRGAAAHAKAPSTPPAFGYLFAQAPWFNLYKTGTPPNTTPIPACEPANGNVCHANELPYVFNTLGAVPSLQQPTDGDRALAQTMAAAWASFANNPASPAPWTGSPGYASLPTHWTPYSGKSSSLVLWNTAGSGSVPAASIDTSANCSALWNTIAPIGGH